MLNDMKCPAFLLKPLRCRPSGVGRRVSLLLLALTVAWPSGLRAQAADGAVALLDRAAAAYQQNGGVEASFHIDVLAYGGKLSGNIEGTILLKGSKFKLTVPGEMITWFDGRNQWLYLQDVGEVNLSNPSEEELLQMNPVNVFLLYRHGFDARRSAEKSWRGQTVTAVVLTPKDPHSDLDNIEIYFEKASLHPLSIRITNKDRSGSAVTVTSYAAGKTYPESMFVFPQKEYPMAEVIDLR